VVPKGEPAERKSDGTAGVASAAKAMEGCCVGSVDMVSGSRRGAGMSLWRGTWERHASGPWRK